MTDDRAHYGHLTGAEPAARFTDLLAYGPVLMVATAPFGFFGSVSQVSDAVPADERPPSMFRSDTDGSA